MQTSRHRREVASNPASARWRQVDEGLRNNSQEPNSLVEFDTGFDLLGSDAVRFVGGLRLGVSLLLRQALGFGLLGSDAVGLVGRFLGLPFLLSSFFGQGLGLSLCGNQ